MDNVFLVFVIVFLCGMILGVMMTLSLTRPNYPRY